MKFTATKSNLMNAINAASRAVPTRTAMTILECFRMEASTEGLSLMANDLELAIEAKADALVAENGVICLDAKMFGEIIRKLPDKNITIETDAGTVKVSCGRAKFVIPSSDADEFPAMPKADKGTGNKLSQPVLKQAIQGVLFCIGRNESDKVMTGVNIKTANGITLAALDGSRIAVRNITTDTTSSEDVIVPGKSMSDLSKLLNGGEEDFVEVYFSKSHAVFITDTTTVVTRLIDGKYYPYEKMFAGNPAIAVTIGRQELLSCIDRAMLFMKDNDKKPVVCDFMGDACKVSVKSQYGTMDEDISIVKTGDDITFGCNPVFMMDVLKALESDDVTVYLSNKNMPALIKDKEGSYKYLILPVNLSGSSK